MAAIKVEALAPEEFLVEVTEAGESTRHIVHVTGEAVARFTGHEGSGKALVEESFRFLLEREPKEAIMRSFELPVINRYFPEYNEEIRKRLVNRQT